MTEEAADQVDIEGARDGLAEKERVDREGRPRRGGEGAGGQVMPCRVGDDVRGDVIVGEDVSPASADQKVRLSRSARSARALRARGSTRKV